EALTLLAAGLAIALIGPVFQVVAGALIIGWSRPQNAWSSVQFRLSFLVLVSAIVRLVSWILVLTAALGWRETADGTRSSLQFSIRGLMLFTLGVALMCGLARALLGLLGNDQYWLSVNVLDDLPIVLCWLVGAWLAVTRWKHHPQVSLTLLVGLAIHLAN